MISAVETGDELTGERVYFPALKVMEQKPGYCRRESCVGWEVGEASKISFSCKILRSVCRKVTLCRRCCHDLPSLYFPFLLVTY